MDITDKESFMSYVMPVTESGCWIWVGFVNELGYGQLTIKSADGSKSKKAHRHAYELLIGEIPKGLELDHLCRVRCCVNPHHLELVTQKENTRRGLSGNMGNPLTHCINGHKYTAKNTYISPTHGRRSCKTCRKISHAKSNAKVRDDRIQTITE